MKDAILNKVAAIERCVKRIREEYIGKEDSWKIDFTVQDSILLNLQRACESSIDLANFIVKKRKLGIPQNSRDAFDFLAQAKIINEPLQVKMKHMVGFRNMAVHEYHVLDLSVIDSIIRNNLEDFQEFTKVILRLENI
ncbi:MAG: type VII toxin-antitoxin system HepT family RNase toxin [Cyclobacteriaceae bacterium]|jgi:uncharacterized protein YutE (UPF0331/DUF86 family)